MKHKQPYLVRLGEVQLVRSGESVEIRYPEPDIPTNHFTIGPELAQMTDEVVLEIWNEHLRARAEFAAQFKHVAVEVPLGSPQIEYLKETAQWVSRGGVVRCLINDDENNLPVIEIDDRELSWEEFGKLVVTYSGWGMRIAFVPEDEMHRPPRVVVREPTD